MLITRVEEGKGKKYRVFADEQFLFSLFGKELKQFHLRVDEEISDDVVKHILDMVVYKRAKERALFLLERKPLSIHMLREKLVRNEYPVDVIDKVIYFLEQYHYVDDLEYTRMYVETYSKRKSRKQIQCDLYRKGISRVVLEEYFLENDYSEDLCFEKQFQRYTRGKNLQDFLTRQKVFRYFYGKGFSSTLIETHISENME